MNVVTPVLVMLSSWGLIIIVMMILSWNFEMLRGNDRVTQVIGWLFLLSYFIKNIIVYLMS